MYALRLVAEPTEITQLCDVMSVFSGEGRRRSRNDEDDEGYGRLPETRREASPRGIYARQPLLSLLLFQAESELHFRQRSCIIICSLRKRRSKNK